MQPLRDLLLITLDEKEKKKGSLYIVEAWESAADQATVDAVGKEVKDVKVGDRIKFNPYAALSAPEETQRLIREKDVLGLL